MSFCEVKNLNLFDSSVGEHFADDAYDDFSIDIYTPLIAVITVIIRFYLISSGEAGWRHVSSRLRQKCSSVCEDRRHGKADPTEDGCPRQTCGTH